VAANLAALATRHHRKGYVTLLTPADRLINHTPAGAVRSITAG